MIFNVMYLLLILSSLVLPYQVEARKQLSKPYLIVQSQGGGMFNEFDHVLSALDAYDKSLLSGVEVDFSENGIYYDPMHGPNWWNYFCEPIHLGTSGTRIIKSTSLGKIKDLPNIETQFSRQHYYALITKYIFLKPYIQDKIDAFINDQFSGSYVIGIHYRGTDKYLEAPQVAYEAALLELNKQIALLDTSAEVRIFIATDEWAFIEYLSFFYPDCVCYYQNAPRSTDGTPVHMNSAFSGYDKGETALIDCILLSRCDFLIRCSSNLSRWSTYFNPLVPVMELNQRY